MTAIRSDEKQRSAFQLAAADSKEFAIHSATYRENVFFRQSWERRVAMFKGSTTCYWIMQNGQRMGGICLEPNALSSFFVMPPYPDLFDIVSFLKQELIACSETQRPIHVYGILPDQVNHFLRFGFLPSESRRVMIRPTETFASHEWGEDLICIAPSLDQIDRIAELLFASYADTDSIGYPGKNTIEQHKSTLEAYLNHQQASVLTSASRVVFDTNRNTIVGVCFISLWEDLPLVSNIAVLPSTGASTSLPSCSSTRSLYSNRNMMFYVCLSQ